MQTPTIEKPTDNGMYWCWICWTYDLPVAGSHEDYDDDELMMSLLGRNIVVLPNMDLCKAEITRNEDRKFPPMYTR